MCSLEGCRSTIELYPPMGASPPPGARAARCGRRPQGRRAVGVRARGESRSAALLQEGGSTAGRSPTSAVHGSSRRLRAPPLGGGAWRRGWWGKQDSNLRRLSHQIYSLTPLTAREFPLGRAPQPPGRRFGARGPPTRRPVQSRVHLRRSRRRPGHGPGMGRRAQWASRSRVILESDCVLSEQSHPGPSGPRPSTSVEPAAGLEPATC